MKAINIIACAALMMLASCSDKDNWVPGSKVDPNCPEVYFEDSDGAVSPEDTFLELTVSRINTTNAITVPVKLVRAAEGITVPESSVSFAAGEKSVKFRVDFDQSLEYEVGYDLRLELEESFTNPYAAERATIFDGHLRRLEPWTLVAEMTCTYEARSGNAVFDPFKQKLYTKKVAGLYYIENWCLNNTGEDWGNFYFSLNADNKIIPDPAYGYHGAAGRWYFYVPGATSDSSSWQIPGYLPNANNHYMTYYYLYLVGSTDSAFAMDFNAEEKTITLGGYTRFNSGGFTAGRFHLHYTW
jgi:hypothetical protein